MSRGSRHEQPRRSPRKSTAKANRLATSTDYANHTFQPIKADLKAAGVSLSAWLDRAKDEYLLFQYALAALAKNDVELSAFVQSAGADAVLHLHDKFGEQEKTYKAGTETLKTTQVRLMCALSRVFMTEEVAA